MPLKSNVFFICILVLTWVVPDEVFLIFGIIISYNLVVNTFPFIADSWRRIDTSLMVFLAWQSLLKASLISLIAQILPLLLCWALHTWPKLPFPTNSISLQSCKTCFHYLSKIICLLSLPLCFRYLSSSYCLAGSYQAKRRFSQKNSSVRWLVSTLC